MERPAKHISIEGFDGVGKTTVCKLLSVKLGCKFVEKPLHYLFDDDSSFEQYIRIRDKVNACPNRDFTAGFYGLGSLYLYHLFHGENIVTDRHLCSNFAWSGTDGNEDVYELLLDKLGKPYLTVVLYAKPETIRKRLEGRNQRDPDIKRTEKSEEIYRKMRLFCKKHGFNTLWINTDDITPDRIVGVIVERLNDMGGGSPSLFQEATLGR